MKSFFTCALVGLLIFTGIVGIGWVLTGNQFLMYGFFAPKVEAVRRDTFEQSKAYRQGMAQELENMRFQYEQADPKHREALASIIRHRVADLDPSALSPDMRAFVISLSNGKPSTFNR